MGSLSKAHPLSKDWPGPGLPTALDCLEGSSSGPFSWQAIWSIQAKNCSTDSSALRQSSLASQQAEPHKGPCCPQHTESARDSPIPMCSTTAGPLGNKCTFQPFGYKQSYNQMLKPPFSISHGIYIPIQTFYKKSLRHCRNWTLLLWTEWWSPNSDCCCCPVAQLCPTLCDPMDCSMPGFSALLHLQSLLKLMSIESVMHSNHLVLCCPLLLLPSIFPSIRIFSNESALHIRWPKYWSFSISPSNECSGLISFRIDWFDFPAVQWTLNSLLQHHSSKFRYWSPNSPMSKG